MSLDLHAVALQVQTMAGDLQSSRRQRLDRVEAAIRTLRRPLDRSEPGPISPETLLHRMDAGANRKNTWLIGRTPPAAIQDNNLARSYPAPSAPPEYAVLATDGSQIDVDRHGPAHCFLINTGGAYIRYGANPGAKLLARPYLYSNPEETAIREPGGVREQAIEGPVLGIKRMVMECLALEEWLRAVDPGIATLALLDGSLVLWELSGERYPDFLRAHLLDGGLLPALDSLHALATSRSLAFGSYISLPRATEVVNILRVAYCPHEGLEFHGCDAFCSERGKGKKECNRVALGLMDRDLFEEFLEPGQRSEIFFSQSPIVVKRYGMHQVCFFYLHTGNEIARVELPRWVAENADSLDLLHAGILDQCRKGSGYPVALQEAHERAVVTMEDRRAFWGLVESALDRRGLAPSGSLKARSKRTRAV